MKTHEFIIIASGLDPTADDFEARFYDHGCDDALVAFQKGHIVLEFAREADSMEDAIDSAVADVRRAGATIDRIEPDPLVSLSEIACRSRMTRAAVSQYAKGRRQKGFPAPKVRITTESPLWEWVEVARWLHDRRKLSGSDLADAEAVRRANGRIASEGKDA